LLRRANNDLKNTKQPFFCNVMTLSSHEPFELPNETGWGIPNFQKTDDIDALFNNAMYYTDQAVGEFIREAKKQAWWQNTIVVIIADHGSPHVAPHDNEFHNFHIPMLWLGGAFAKQDTVIHTVGSQTDIAATVLGQMDMPHQEYSWSKNIMTKDYRPFAYFNYHNGFGFVKKDGRYAYDTEGGYVRRQEGQVTDKDIDIGKAYIQMTYEDYMKK
jgi:phosphoglycerol transferase MdoB-like AlkP superfamily enzyme